MYLHVHMVVFHGLPGPHEKKKKLYCLKHRGGTTTSCAWTVECVNAVHAILMTRLKKAETHLTCAAIC